MELHLLPQRVAARAVEPGETVLALDPVGGFLDAAIVEIDAVARHVLDRQPVAGLELTGDATPGRLIVAAPWPADREAVLGLRDAVAPLLHGNPLILLLGAPRARIRGTARSAC